MKRLFSRKSGLIVLRWMAVAAALHLGTIALNLQATPANPITRTGMIVGWIPLVFFPAAVYNLFAKGWRSPLVWICAGLAAVNYAAVAVHSDRLTALIAVSSLAVAAVAPIRYRIDPKVQLAAASSFVLGLAGLFAGMLLASPFNGICSRFAPWVCQLTGVLVGGMTAALMCAAFWYSGRRLDCSGGPAV